MHIIIPSILCLSLGISLSTATSQSSSQSSSAYASSSAENETTVTKSPYKIVIDGGSTGSRLHIFEFIQNPQTSKTFIERRGSTKVNIPLSYFASSSSSNQQQRDDPRHINTYDVDDDEAALHLLPLFQFASEIIPMKYHSTTHVSLQATAGMRLVDIESQNALYDTIHEKLMNHEDFVFDGFRRTDLNTLDGVLEGLYGVIAVNYLKGVVDVNLEYEYSNYERDSTDEVYDENESNDGQICTYEDVDYAITRPFGALDLGGASMQIVFLPSKANGNERSTCPSIKSQEKLPSHEFYSTSYLSYGSDQFRERLWDLWTIETQQGIRKQIDVQKKMIENPCSFVGHEIDWGGYTLYGTGKAKECTDEINRLIPHHEEVDHDNDEYVVGGIQHPEIHGEFYAMSLFFFVMDCVREYTQDEVILKSWPNPSLHELSTAVETFCSKHWIDDMLNIHGLEMHRFTKGNRLSERCFESSYIVALLRDGFGFDVHSRDITYSFLVDDSEVEWSLGMAISLYAEDGKNIDASILSSSNNNNDENDLGPNPCEENSTDCQQQNDNNDDEEGKRTPGQGKDILNQIIQNESMWSLI